METAVRDQSENAAERTSRPDDNMLVYLGDGRWRTPYGIAKADRDADPETILNRAREAGDGER